MESRLNVHPNMPVRTRTEIAKEVHGDKPISYQDKEFPQLEGHLNLESLEFYASTGGARETILVDTTSPELIAIFNHAFPVDEFALTQAMEDADEKSAEENNIATLGFNLDNPIDLFKHILNKVCDLFPDKYSLDVLENKIAELAEKQGPKKIILLETFVKAEIALCRHKALLTGYLLSTFYKNFASEKIPAIFQFRTDLVEVKTSDLLHPARTAHAVIICVYKNGEIWLLDATRRAEGLKGLVVELTNLDQDKRNLLNVQYKQMRNYDTALFVDEILKKYQKNAPQLSQSYSSK